MELPEREICYRALQSRDARFDGLLFVGVTSTGIYCRPGLSGAHREIRELPLLRFSGSGAGSGFSSRACVAGRRRRPIWLHGAELRTRFLVRLRSLPTALLTATAPASKRWRNVLASVNVTSGDCSFSILAPRLSPWRRPGVCFLPSSSSTKRTMPMTEVALAAGFGSVRRFNEIFRDLFHRPPSALRRKTSANPAGPEAGVTLRLRYRPPYDWDSMLGYLQARAIPGVEIVENGSYLRTVGIDGFTGSVEVTHLPHEQSLGVTIRFPNVQIAARNRDPRAPLFDVGADIETIDAHLSLDPLLAPFVAQRPGIARARRMGWF